MSGDSKVGNSTFDMTGGSLTSKNGGMFYTTNTEGTFPLNTVIKKGSNCYTITVDSYSAS